MEEMADRAVVNGSNVGRLHLDFPMDPNTDRFERRLQSSMERVKKATDELDGVVGYGQDVRGAMAEVRELVEEVRDGMKVAKP
jgi:deoxyribose-phosphate aldolase